MFTCVKENPLGSGTLTIWLQTGQECASCGTLKAPSGWHLDKKLTQKIICIGMGGLLFWELDNVWSIYWKDNWIFIYLLFFLSTWKKLKGLHCGQVPASYFDTCRKSEVRKWCIFIIIHWNIHGLVNIIFSPISTCSPCQKSLFQFVRSLSKIKPVHNGGSTGLQEIINNKNQSPSTTNINNQQQYFQTITKKETIVANNKRNKTNLYK